MNATCKRLLSWLVVVTMVLSMLPVVDLSGFAITTKAALSEEEQTAKTNAETVIADAKALKDTFKDKTGIVEAICPVCGGEEPVEWHPFTSDYVNNTTRGHYYLTEDFVDTTAYSNAHDAVLKPVDVKVCFNLNGKNLTAEKKKAISVIYSVELNIIDTAETEGVVKGYFPSNGGAGQTINMFNAGAEVNIYGGTYQKITSDSATSNSTQRSAVVGAGQGTFNWYGGKIDGTLSHTYKNNYVAAGVQLTGTATFNMYGGSIINCESTGSGGAVNVGYTTSHSGTVFNMLGGTVSGNISAACGGNFYVFGTLNVKGGTIENGVANGVFNAANKLGGGNISLNAGTVTVSGGTISGGVAKGSGGNIHVRDNTTGKINVSGGKIIDGKSSTSSTEGLNIWVNSGAAGSELKISGGKISSGIFYGANTAFELSGNPEIKVSGIEGQTVNAAAGFAVTDGGNLDVSKITGGEIQIEGALGDVFSASYENAAEIAQYFVPTNPALMVVANNNKLEIVEYVEPSNDPVWGVFDPAGCGGLAYCEHCGQAAGPKEWTDFNTLNFVAGSTLATGHYYLSAPITDTTATAGTAYIKNTSGAGPCFNLNGNNLTVENGRVFGSNNQTVKINIMDTKGGAVVSGNSTNTYGSVFSVGGAKGASVYNIYGGTFTKANGNNVPVVYFTGNGGTVNMYGGTLDTSTCDKDSVVFMQGSYRVDENAGTASDFSGVANFNLSGGTIKGGNNGYLIQVGSNTASGTGTSFLGSANFTMTSGAISGGTKVLVRNDNVMTISGGTISTVIETVGSGDAENKTTVKLVGAVDLSTAGIQVGANSVLNVDELTGTAKVKVDGEVGTVIATSANASAVVACFTAAEGKKVKLNGNQLLIAQDAPEADVFEPWEHEGYAYCPVCKGEPVEWTAIDSNFDVTTTLANGKHYYLSEAITNGSVAGQQAFFRKAGGGVVCFNLNGKELTVTDGRVFGQNFMSGTLNVMDTEDASVVTGYYNGAAGAVFYLNGGNGASKVNVYGGTFKKAYNAAVEGSRKSSVVFISGNGGTFTMYGGTIDTAGVENLFYPTAIYAQGAVAGETTYGAPAVVIMKDGTIIGGNSTGNGGAVYIGNANGNAAGNQGASFTMDDGTIYGGTTDTTSGGNVAISNDNTFVMNGGVIGGNVMLLDSPNSDAKTTATLTGSAKILNGYGQATAKNGLHVQENTVVNVDGLTEGAMVYINGAVEATLIESANAATVKDYLESFYAEFYVDAAGNAISLQKYAVAVENAEGKTFYKTAEEAIANAEGGYLQAYKNQEIVLGEDDVVYLDNRGFDTTVSGNGTLYAMDSANDDYVGYGSWTVADGVTVVTDVINPINGNRYIVIKNTEEGTAYSAHRVELELTHVSLRTSQAGLYYKAAYKCDGTLAGRVNAFGIVFSGVYGEVHQGNFDAVKDIYSIAETGFTPDENHTVNGTSVAVFGIFKDGRTAAENIAAGELKIHATPYINVDADANGVSEADNYVLGNVQNDTYKANAGVVYKAMSLYDVLKSINDNWAAYESAQEQVKKFYQKWATKGMDAWATDLANIANA